MSNKPILCLDFDGVLHSYTSGWKGAEIIPDPPVPGAMEFICRALEVFEVNIYSSRSHQPNGIKAMRAWLEWYMLGHVLSYGGEEADMKKIVDQVVFPSNKPSAMVSIDDRALTFDGTWPETSTLIGFKPWNKK